MKSARELAQSLNKPIKLLVEDRIFETTVETLMKQKGSYFDIIANGQWKPNKEGNIM